MHVYSRSLCSGVRGRSKEDMLITFFFCKLLLVVPTSSRGTNSAAVGHWALWGSKYQIEHRDVSLGNLMHDRATRRGVLNGFRLGSWLDWVDLTGNRVRKTIPEPCRSWMWTLHRGFNGIFLQDAPNPVTPYRFPTYADSH